METITKKIGLNKYTALKQYDLSNLTEEMLEKFHVEFPDETVSSGIKSMQDFEESRSLTTDQKESIARYMKKVREPKQQIVSKNITQEHLWNRFIKNYREINDIDFNYQAEHVVENIKPLFYYFTKNEKAFKNCSRVSQSSNPSLDKGLLIVGGYGNGKSSIMKTLDACLVGTESSFKLYTANSIVTEYEAIQDAASKEVFNKKYNRGKRCFDDVLTERQASNYGKVDLFKDIIENRYDNNFTTHINCNYRDGHEGDLDNALDQFEERYGGRVYDRLFAMFNIIEFKGSSFRN
jgi:DNA replication protein DnaC